MITMAKRNAWNSKRATDTRSCSFVMIEYGEVDSQVTMSSKQRMTSKKTKGLLCFMLVALPQMLELRHNYLFAYLSNSTCASNPCNKAFNCTIFCCPCASHLSRMQPFHPQIVIAKRETNPQTSTWGASVSAFNMNQVEHNSA